MTGEGAQVYFRTIGGQGAGNLSILDAIRLPDGRTVIYFPKSVSDEAVTAALPVAGGATETLLGGVVATLPDAPDGVTPSLPEPEILAGGNVIVATRNGETVQNVIDWLTYHQRYFRLDGAVIFCRGEGSEAEALGKAIAQLDLPVRVILVTSGLPLGKPGLPPEAHPFCVSEAPGHDRMKVPEPDPWTAPLGEMAIYEIARHRFLGQVRAVANIDLCDLLFETPGKLANGRPFETPFDMAAAHPGELVQLEGRHCYPWRVRKGAEPLYADHVCVQFDKPRYRQRWCLAPARLDPDSALRIRRVRNATVCGRAEFYRFMAVRHPVRKVSRIVPKTSLIEHKPLLALSRQLFDHKPVRPPQVDTSTTDNTGVHTAIVTTMKNEGPFILEWLAYHQAIGVQDFLVYTNDCNDGTDTMFDLLQSRGILQHRRNPFRELGLKPQHGALRAAEDEPLIRNADWVICMDVDEFLNVKVGGGTLAELYEAVGDANLIACTWRLFGNADIHHFTDEYTIGMFDRCAREFTPKPHQAWGFKTLYRNTGIFKKLGVHRPKGLRPQLWEQVRWVNGSGKPLPRREFRNAWRSTATTYGYDLVSLNHYAVRNAESFLVKRDRGRVNHVDRDQGLAYWFRMNNNATTDRSIMKRIPMMEERLAQLMSDPEIAAQHHACVAAHRAKIDALLQQPTQQTFYNALTSPRMEKLSRMHHHFGSNVFLSGPDSVPDDVVTADHAEDFFFTVGQVEEGQH